MGKRETYLLEFFLIYFLNFHYVNLDIVGLSLGWGQSIKDLSTLLGWNWNVSQPCVNIGFALLSGPRVFAHLWSSNWMQSFMSRLESSHKREISCAFSVPSHFLSQTLPHKVKPPQSQWTPRSDSSIFEPVLLCLGSPRLCHAFRQKTLVMVRFILFVSLLLGIQGLCCLSPNV